MSIEADAKVRELEKRVAALEDFLGERARQYVERHLDKVVAHLAGIRALERLPAALVGVRDVVEVLRGEID